MLETVTASKYHRRLWSTAQKDLNMKNQLLQGNHTHVQSKSVFAKARSEKKAESDLDSDVFMDLMKRQEEFAKMEHLKADSFPGYMQELFKTPFVTSLYTEKQLKLLHRLLKIDRGTVLHIDSTGGFTSKLPVEFGTKRIFYYSIVAQFPGNEDIACVPLAEFLTNSHDVGNITTFLMHFFKK